MGLSLALGAFLAGLTISASEYSLRALGNILPLRDIFTSFFFVSIGMLLDIHFAVTHVWFALAAVAGVLLLKTAIASVSALLVGFPVRIAILVGLIVSQVGEFSFVLSRTGAKHGLLEPESYQLFIVVSLFTMAATPFIISSSHAVANLAPKMPFPEFLRRGRHNILEDERPRLSDHVVIVGFGVIGRNLAHSAKLSDIPYAIIDVNRDTVLQETKKGERILYGDAADEAVLNHVDIKAARVLAVTIPDPATTRRVTGLARRLNPGLYIIARTRFLQEMAPLYAIGANEVIPEEFEASVEIFSRVLRKCIIPLGEIENYAAQARADSYGLFRECADRVMDLSERRRRPPPTPRFLNRHSASSPAGGAMGTDTSIAILHSPFGTLDHTRR